MKKILFIMPSMRGGGAERTLINLLIKTDYSKFSIDLLIISNNGVLLHDIPEEVNVIKLLNSDFWARTLAYLQKKCGFFFVLKWLINSKGLKKYDVGISFLDGETTDLLFLIDGIAKRFSWVHSSYQTNDNFAKFYRNEKYRNLLINNRYSKLDGIYFVSKDAKEEFIEVFGTYPEMHVVYNLIDAATVKYKADLQIIESDGIFTFVALGSLVPVKGFDRLIRAAKLVHSNGLHFQLKIIGSGNELSILQTLINKLELSDTVHLLGFKKNPYPYLKSCDVFVMSSISEALPTVLCEAMILGKAVLVTNCSGCREIVDNEKYGLLSNQSDEDLARKMIKFIQEPLILQHYGERSLIRSKIFDDDLAIIEYHKIFDL